MREEIIKEIPFFKFNHFYIEHVSEIGEIISETLSSGNYIRSKGIIELESRLAKLCDRKYAITTGSCTDALFFALIAGGIKPGDEVILPSFSYIATLSAVLRCRAKPVFVDICPDSLMIDHKAIIKAVSKKTKAIIFVQLFGNCIEIEPFQKIAKEHNLLLVEDAAQALGSSYKNKPGGSFGDISCISFDPTKIISAYATGGVLLTDDHSVYQGALSLSHHGRISSGGYETLGYNSKMSALSASLIDMQLNYLKETIDKYRLAGERYVMNLNKNKHVSLIIPGKNVFSTFHKLVIKVKNREVLIKELKNQGVQTNIHYYPVLYEHALLKHYSHKIISNKNTESAKTEVISLPIYPELSFRDIDYICDIINTFTKI